MAIMPAAVGLVSPVLILVLCVVAGVGTTMLLPGRKEGPIRKMGGAIILAAGLILAALLARSSANRVGIHLYFWIFSFIALAGAIRVVTHPRPVYAALYFVLTVFATAGLFVLLWAEFMAAALILIYAGAILITYVFVIMLASQASAPQPAASESTRGGLAAVTEYDDVSREPLVASAVGFAMMGILLFVIFDKGQAVFPREDPQAKADVDGPYLGSTQQLGRYLFENQVVNLELAGLILTISTVGAIVIARRRVLTGGAGLIGRNEILLGPATPVDDDPHSIPVFGTDNPRQKEYPET